MYHLAKLSFLSLLLVALLVASPVDAKKKKGQCARHKISAPQHPSSSSSSSSSPAPWSSASHPTSSGPGASSSAGSAAAPSKHDSHIVHPSSSAPPASSATSSPSGGSTPSKKGGNQDLIPNGIKAGVAGGDALPWLSSHLGWYYDWSPNPNNTHADKIQRIPMLWGLGTSSDSKDKERFEEFKKLPKPAGKYVAGFNEPDFSGSGSSGFIEPKKAAQAWDTYIAPHGKAGAKLISPSCAKQSDETWMKPFLDAVQTKPDIISVHIFANNTDLLKKDLDHYAQYGKPMIVTELACIDYQGTTKYCDQGRTNSLIQQAVSILESDDRVVGYALSDAYNGPKSYLTTAYTGARAPSLTTTGYVYLGQVTKYSKRQLARSVRALHQHSPQLLRRRLLSQ